MLSWLANLLWELFVAAPWWLEILIAFTAFWALLLLLLFLILVIYDVLIFFGIPLLILRDVLLAVFEVIISICKALKIPVDSLIKVQKGIENNEKLRDKK